METASTTELLTSFVYLPKGPIAPNTHTFQNPQGPRDEREVGRDVERDLQRCSGEVLGEALVVETFGSAALEHVRADDSFHHRLDLLVVIGVVAVLFVCVVAVGGVVIVV